jgi:hypothetical protein
MLLIPPIRKPRLSPRFTMCLIMVALVDYGTRVFSCLCPSLVQPSQKEFYVFVHLHVEVSVRLRMFMCAGIIRDLLFLQFT